MNNGWMLDKFLPLKGNFPLRTGLFSLLFSLFSFSATAQEIEASIDTASIKIGEQITYSISVEIDSSNLVVFPEGQTFSPLEMIESYTVDTSRIDERYRLLKEYALTQFDSGTYTIPQQRVIINDKTILTDSFLVEVNTVLVDTTKQKLYPIKPSVEIPPGFVFPSWGWWIIAILVLGLLIYLFLRRKKKKEEAAKKLPPYEQAILELRQLDDSHLLENREIKEYYSQLSASVRKYLDEEVYDRALESTSGELILYLEAQKNTGNLKVENSTIERLQEILKRADLAKFANSKPDVITAREDRSSAEGIINETKEGIPQPTEEELLEDQAYLEKQEKKQKRKKILYAVLAVLVVIGGISAYMISTKGFSYVVDSYFGHPTKELLEGEWIQSEYGNPSISIVTPEVLVRDEIEVPTGAASAMVASETFSSGSLLGNYYVLLSTKQFNQQAQFDLEAAVDGIYSFLEEQGAKNIITKREDFSTLNGAEGIKIFGSFQIEDPVTEETVEKQYAILNFAENGGYQQITVIYNEDDDYADEVTERILNSVELKNIEN